MDKKKKEQIILIILIPIFLLGLLYVHSQKGTPAKGIKTDIAATATEGQITDIPDPEGALKIIYAESPKDPLQNILIVYVDEINKTNAGIEVRTDIPMPPLSIEGLIWNTDVPQAIINGKVVRKGDMIEGVKILEINGDGITVEHNSQPVFIDKTKKGD
jgi:hypothetical protein